MRPHPSLEIVSFEAMEPRVMLSGAADLVHSSTNLSAPRNSIAPVLAGTKTLFVGGDGGGNGSTPSTVIDVYDRLTAQWSTMQMPDARAGGAAAAAGAKAIIAGDAVADPTVDIYDAQTR